MALPQPPGMMRGMTLAAPDHEAIAAEALAAIDNACQIVPFSSAIPALPSTTPIASRPACASYKRREAST
jgi:hypothetical protein